MKRIFTSLLFSFCIVQAWSQIVISNLSATPFDNNVLRYHVIFNTNEDATAYVEWQRIGTIDEFGGDGIYPIEHSNLQGPSMAFDFELIGFVNNNQYQYRVITWNEGSCVASEWASFDTGSLPSDVSTITNVYTSAPGLEGYYMTNNVSTPDKTIQIFNRSGEVVWYDWHSGVDGFGGIANCQMWDVTDDGNILMLECHRLQERDLLGNVIHEVDFTGTEYENLFFHHDVIKNTAGNYVAIAAELRLFDFTSLGGIVDQPVVGEGLLEFDINGNVIHYWTTFDHWDPIENAATQQNAFFTPIFGASAINWQHLNSVNQDSDGNYLLSFKELNRLAKVDILNDEILFTLSGAGASIDIQNDNGFGDQHDFTDVTEPNKYIVYDNTGATTNSRMVEFAIDYYKVPIAYTTWSFNFPDSLFSPILGSARRLAGGHHYGVCGAPFADFARKGHIIEVDENNEIVWHARQNSWVYRAYFYPELWIENEIEILVESEISSCPSIPLTLVASPEGGFWSGTGVTDGVFSTNEPGDYWVYYKYGWEQDSTLIHISALPELTVEVSDVNCFGESNGSAELFVNGESFDSESELAAGDYSFLYTDENGCLNTAEYSVNEPEVLTCELEITNETNGGDGEACVEVTGGVSSYQIFWSNETTEECANDLTAGEYSVSVTDANGCTCSQDFTVFVGVSEMNATPFNIYPNPAQEVISITGISDSNDVTSIELFDATGRKVKTVLNGETTVDVSELAQGHYSIRIISQKGTTVLSFVKKD